MLKKITLPFFSMLSTGILIIIFAISIAYATFIENDYGAATAKFLIYNSWWFEVLLYVLAINLIGSIIIHKLINRKKWAIFLFHLGFIFILIGAAATRYTGFEGFVHIREGEQTNKLTTSSNFVKVEALAGDESHTVIEEVHFSPKTKNQFDNSFSMAGKKVKLDNLTYVPSATETVVPDPAGIPMLNLMAMDRFGGRIDFILRENEVKSFGPLGFIFAKDEKPFIISVWEEDGRLLFSYPDTVEIMSMGQAVAAKLVPGNPHDLLQKTIYSIGHFSFVLKEFVPKGRIQLISVPSHTGTMSRNAVTMNVRVGNITQELIAYESEDGNMASKITELDGIQFSTFYGRVEEELPFFLRLNEFQLERYPGSNSPSSFASEVTLIDTEHNVERDYRIYMNNILKYRGYRFFQSSYDKDEMGTILSVNFDSLGTAITYFGYFIMTLGMIFTLFARGSRFRRLAAASAKLRLKRQKLFTPVLVLAFLLSGTSLMAQQENAVSKEHAREFGMLQIQSVEGRIEPVNTLASKILRKLSGTNSHNGLNHVQFFMEVSLEPELWLDKQVIKVSNSDLKKVLGVQSDLITFHDVFSSGENAGYKLEALVNEAYDKKPSERNKFDKEVISLDERVNIFYMLLNGSFLTIFPIPDADDNKWVDLSGALQQNNTDVAQFASSTMMAYKNELKQAKLTGDYSKASQLLSELKENQKKFGAEIYHSEMKTKLEVFYINFNLYSKLNKLYLLAGLLLLILQFTILLKPSFKGQILSKAGFWFVMGLFFVHTIGLSIRWYISGHAPWSNGYETMLYISWSACLAGLVFARRSPMTLAITTILAAITLFVAGMSWMNPELTNLVPVLKSYWLIIHVAIITASYGFLGMGALLGLANLVLMILRTDKNSDRIDFTIRELGYIIQMALIVGLFMLTIGSFLGGVWANESWGRYWGWDPKETWALVTILVYAFITHMHKIKGFQSAFALSSLSLLGFSSVLMTFFGVNYYLSGLHSYAQGDPPPVPAGVYIALFVVLFIVGMAYLAQRSQIPVDSEDDLPDESDN